VRYSVQQVGLDYSSISVHLCSSVVPTPFFRRHMIATNPQSKNDATH
jgi:hypothetical protein